MVGSLYFSTTVYHVTTKAFQNNNLTFNVYFSLEHGWEPAKNNFFKLFYYYYGTYFHNISEQDTLSLTPKHFTYATVA